MGGLFKGRFGGVREVIGVRVELELQRGAAGATPVPCVASSQLLQWNALFRFREEVDSNVVILQPWVVFF